MPEVRQHGQPRQEPERHDELSAGIAAKPVHAGAQERSRGRFVAGSAEAKANASKGGSSLRGGTRLSHRIDAPNLAAETLRRVRTLRRSLVTEIADTVGGGYCGIAASLFIKFAAQKTGAAEEAFERGDYESHRKLSESARMDLLYAREHAAREATARSARQPARDPMAHLLPGGTR